jgi:hypothetical protein
MFDMDEGGEDEIDEDDGDINYNTVIKENALDQDSSDDSDSEEDIIASTIKKKNEKADVSVDDL